MNILIISCSKKNNSGKGEAKKNNVDAAEKDTTGVLSSNKEAEVSAEAEADQVREKIHSVKSFYNKLFPKL